MCPNKGGEKTNLLTAYLKKEINTSNFTRKLFLIQDLRKQFKNKIKTKIKRKNVLKSCYWGSVKSSSLNIFFVKYIENASFINYKWK